MKKGMFIAYGILLSITITTQSCEVDPILPSTGTDNYGDTTWVGDTTNNDPNGGNGTPTDSTGNNDGNGTDSTYWNGGNGSNGTPGDSTWGNGNPSDSLGGN